MYFFIFYTIYPIHNKVTIQVFGKASRKNNNVNSRFSWGLGGLQIKQVPLRLIDFNPNKVSLLLNQLVQIRKV